MPSGSSASRSAASSGSIASRMSAALASSRWASSSFWSSSDSSWMTSASRSSSIASATSYRSCGVEVPQDAGGVRGAQPLEGGEHLLRAAHRNDRSARPDPSRGRRSSRPPAPGRAGRSGGSAPGRPAGRPPSPGSGSVRSPTSTTIAELAVVASWTWTPSNWPISRSSSVRCSNRRRLTDPVDSATACDSRLPTRSIGTKMRPPGGQFHDQPEDPRRLAIQPQGHHDVPDLADRFTARARTPAARRAARRRLWCLAARGSG